MKPVDSMPRRTEAGRFKLAKVMSDKWSDNGACTGAGSGMESLLGRGEGAEPNHWLTDLIKLDKNDTGLMFP